MADALAPELPLPSPGAAEPGNACAAPALDANANAGTKPCGRFTDPTTGAAFDASGLCDASGRGLVARNDPTWVVNVCGRVRGGCSRATTTFCVVPEDSVCGIDAEAELVGSVVRRNFSETCGSVKCARCGVAAREGNAAGIAYGLLEVGNPGKGFQARLPTVPMTSAQKDQKDRGGHCLGDVRGRTSTLRFVCDCSRKANGAVLDQVWVNPDNACELNFDIHSIHGCYDGFCEGKLPPLLALKAGSGGSFSSAFTWVVFLALVLTGFYVYAWARTRSFAADVSRVVGVTTEVVGAAARGTYTRMQSVTGRAGATSTSGGGPPVRGATIFAAPTDAPLDEQL